MFTDASIKRLPARDLPYREFERGEIPGFCLQVQPSGSRTFYLQHTVAGKRRFYRLGVYPHLSLSAARAMAREHLAMLATGGDPQAPRRAEFGTVADLLEAWLIHQRERDGRRLDDVERAIRGNCGPIMERAAVEVTATDIRGILAAIHQRGSRVMANRVRAHLHAMWGYGMRHDHDPRQLHRPVRFGLESNPVVSVPRDSAAEKAGERALSWAEVREVWNTERLSIPARQACRLLLCSGNRVNEVVQAPWSEFDLGANEQVDETQALSTKWYFGKKEVFEAYDTKVEGLADYFLIRQGWVSRAHREWALGMTKFRRVAVQDDPAVSYLLKDIAGSDSYELDKTGIGQRLVVSKGLWRASEDRYGAERTYRMRLAKASSTVGSKIPVE